MYYETASNRHGLKFNPFKALAAPRPIGWISTVSNAGVHNLAPYSFFNAISDQPPMVYFSSIGRKDSIQNLEQNGEFTCSIATWDLREQMNMSSAPVSYGVDEFELAGLSRAPGTAVRSARVAQSPAAFECKVWKTIELPQSLPGQDPRKGAATTLMVLGFVVGVYIDDRFVHDGIVDTAGYRPLARMGYMDYAVVTPETKFEMNRPLASDDGKSASVPAGPWDGVYR